MPGCLRGLHAGSWLPCSTSPAKTRPWRRLTYQYDGGIGATVNLFAGNATGGGGNDTVTNFENVIGSAFDDTFFANASANSFVGNGGTDKVDYSNATSAVTIDLSTTVGTGTGGADGDQLVGITTILGSGFDDTMTAAVTGGTLLGAAGNDTFIAGAGTDSFDGGAGTDVVTYAGKAALTIDQTTGDHGSNAARHDTYTTVETIIATSNDDTFIGGTSAGSATMDGGSGNDWADYEYLSGGIGATVDLSAHTSSNAAANDHFVNVENIKGSGYDDVLTASAAGSTLIGGLGNDTLTAANGGSVLIGGSGADTLVGGAGIDTADYSADSTALTVNLATNANHGGTAEGDSLSAIDIVIGGSGDDILTGNATVATTLYGGAGNDTLVGGTQGDWLDGGAGTNTVDYSGNSANLIVNLVTNANAGGTAVGDKLYNIQQVIGGSGDDTLTGNATTTTTLLGGAGNDTLMGGSAGDSFDGGSGSNWLSYANATAGVTVNLSSGATGGGAAGDTITNIQNVIGSGYADTLTAIATGSTLLGGAGNDTLIGGAGNDTLDGGAGADVMDGGGGVNVVTYASSNAITIDLANAGVHGSGDAQGDTYANISTITATNGVDTFIGGTAAGSATMDGGVGSDWIDYEYVGTGATVNLNNSALNGGAAANDKLVQIENIIGSGYNDVLTGSSNLSSTLMGGAGNDTMAGGSAADSFDGGSGIDTVTYNASVLTVTIDQTAGVGGTHHWAGDAYGDLYTTVETIIASTNADTFIGGTASGSAFMDGNTGSDWVSYAYAASGATLTLNATTATSTGSGAAANDRFTSIENVTGSANNDTFVINGAGYVTLDGGAGTDTVDSPSPPPSWPVSPAPSTAAPAPIP